MWLERASVSGSRQPEIAYDLAHGTSSVLASNKHICLPVRFQMRHHYQQSNVARAFVSAPQGRAESAGWDVNHDARQRTPRVAVS